MLLQINPNHTFSTHFSTLCQNFAQDVTTIDDGKTTKTKLEFVRYGTKSRGDKSGAYLFLPGKCSSVIAFSG